MDLSVVSDKAASQGLLARVNPELFEFLETYVLPQTNLNADEFWAGFVQLIDDLTPENRRLLAVRDDLQARIDQWCQENQGNITPDAYKTFLQEIGYLQPQAMPEPITTENNDAEIATMAGPQLVVPVKNARFALNAANARWGSLYDALYGSDIIATEGELAAGKGYNPARGQAVVAYCQQFLDESFPLNKGSHADVNHYSVFSSHLVAYFADGKTTGLANPAQFAGFEGDANAPESVLLRNNGLHVELELVTSGQSTERGSVISDIHMEAALTTIMDCEDSIAAVDAEDKVEVYKNWLGLMLGTLEDTFQKNGETLTRRLNADKSFLSPMGEELTLPGRSLMLVRNVGLLTTSELITDAAGNELPEGIVDAVVTALIGKLDLDGKGQCRNSRTGSIYIVKPKLHGPEEVRFTCELFSRVEQLIGLPKNTLKIGIMDEERRTSLNLTACILAARDRVFFINTGFLDRTGDEIHTSMMAGPFMPKGSLKGETWLQSYEQRNVAIGVQCGFPGRAQIGKGMWAMPDAMAEMMKQKIGHVNAGATTAWVPSPTAATLHAMHYHKVDVFALLEGKCDEQPAPVTDLLQLPLLAEPGSLSAEQIERELENNCQGILGYVVRWIDQGVGCSKVPDINGLGLMEDRATLRISSQHIANWLTHGICTSEQVQTVLARMAAVVDEQNAGDPSYDAMAPNVENSIAYQAARALIFEGRQQPNGYTEPLLHRYRRLKKSA
ncbi:malate synthase G [Halioxenophilus sp. WMMB6]|uniref:malate synthase G n=1 Tax=Halioxenophilus sp. WMMB6 TaxID=3073815 RepID=UPI00295E5AC6|nr:malate synthase G [Halioxenophilus sp. WMMB6]